MIIILHILSALGSLAAGSLAYLRPATALLRVAYSLVAATLLSGTYLVLSRHLGILSVCLSGLLYLSAISFLLVLAHHRLAKRFEK